MEDSSLDDDDDDLKIQRASVHAIAQMKNRAQQLLVCVNNESKYGNMQHRAQRQKLAGTIIDMLGVFQEDPQLLDPHLKVFLPPLLSCFVSSLDSIAANLDLIVRDHLQTMANIIYTFCKVRGDKVLVRFLDNEPKHITPLLLTLNSLVDSANSNEDATEISPTPLAEANDTWKLRYVLLLWAGHLTLTPFDLQSLSEQPGSMDLKIDGIDLSSIPDVAKQLLTASMVYSSSPTKERSSAASVLSKLALRPDMTKYDLLKALVRWALKLLASKDDAETNERTRMFALEFIYGLLRSANVHDISHYLPPIYSTVFGASANSTETLQEAQQSAVSQKLSIKVMRSIIVQLLQIPGSSKQSSRLIHDKMMSQVGILEETIDFLLRSLANRDTQVRNAASKALSMITLKLDNEMALEVVEAVIDSLNEDVLDGHGSDSLQDFSAVNPLRWHGLTLTLSYMLYRRSPSPDQLESILKAQFMTLVFEQRSATGNSLGTNVRDAANFGLWSLARRYTTAELLNVPPSIVSNGIDTGEEISKIQATANKLLCSACLDPSGNVRRGSSAALQELIGRHPDTVRSGIALVQVVDYQAVGLRKRAMVDISFRAAQIDELYLFQLLEGLFGWRGLNAPDTSSRNFAAKAVGRLVNMLPTLYRNLFVNKITSSLRALSRMDAESRHGYSKALSEIVLQNSMSKAGPDLESDTPAKVWSLFDSVFRRTEKELTTPSLRPELITETVISLVYSLSCFILKTSGSSSSVGVGNEPNKAALEMLTLSLQSMDAATVEGIPGACRAVCLILAPAQRVKLVRDWLKSLELKINSKRRMGIMLALASASAILPKTLGNKTDLEAALTTQKLVLDALLAVFNTDDVDARVASIKSLAIIVDGSEHIEERLFQVFLHGLNDYTTNERGDVGSLVRLEAIQTLTSVAPTLLSNASQPARLCYLSLQRLALERLDKVRLHAAQCLCRLWPRLTLHPASLREVSTFEYFSEFSISVLIEPGPNLNDKNTLSMRQKKIEILLEGFASSASAGSDGLSGVVRSSLSAILNALPLRHGYNEDSDADPAQKANPHMPSLLEIWQGLSNLIRANLANDRTLVPLLDLTLFLFDAGLIQHLCEPLHLPSNTAQSASEPKPADQTTSAFKPRTLVSLVQKSHYKSSNLPKLLICVHIYRHLADLPDSNTRTETLKKLCSMLGHPFSKVRVQVAEVLWAVTGEKTLRNVDWAGSSASSEAKKISRLLN